MELKAGSRWQSVVCDGEVIIVRPGEETGNLECGGHPMQPSGAANARTQVALSPFDEGIELGKRYANDQIEVLCTKGGSGSLSVDGIPLTRKDAKALPSSD